MTPTEIEKALRRLSELADKRRNLDDAITLLVLGLRAPNFDGECAASWQEVADALGVTKQSAWRMYRAVDRPS